jgi:hypothetical protein
LCGDDWDLDAYALANTQQQLVANVVSSTTVESHGGEESASDGEDGTADQQEGYKVAQDTDQNATDSRKNGLFGSVVDSVDLVGKSSCLQAPTMSGRFLIPLVAAETPSTDWKNKGM